jgi:predicted N-formylglutamate amidohydrolase
MTTPFATIAGDDAGGLLLLADHASNHIPDDYGGLGLPTAALTRHIAYDIGVAPLTADLARRLGAPAVLSGFSRLLIDPNRGLDDPTLVMRLSDGAIVPGNARHDAFERARRIERFWRPYDTAVGAAIAQMRATGRPPVIVSVHSFTPVWRGWARPWHVGVLWDRDPRLPVPVIAALRREAGLVVGENEPYDGALQGDCLARHAIPLGLAHVLIEVRQDLIGDAAGVAAWGERLARVLTEACRVPGLDRCRRYGSRVDPAAPRDVDPLAAAG